MRVRRPVAFLLVPITFGLGLILFAPLPSPVSNGRHSTDQTPTSIWELTIRGRHNGASSPATGAQNGHRAQGQPAASDRRRPPSSAHTEDTVAEHAHQAKHHDAVKTAEVPLVDQKVDRAFKKAILKYQKSIIRDENSPVIEQSSARFVDFHEPEGPGIEIPVDQHKTDHEELWKFCDPTSTAYTPQTDKHCLAYLSNQHNILYIKPMSAVLSFARTIKFRVQYRHGDPPLKAIMKVAQKKFLFEPYAEALGFFVDRILGIKRVPPTAWIELPISLLQGSVSMMPPFFMQWLQLFVFDFPDAQSIIRTASDGARYMNFSVQLWMSDVHNAYDTSLAPPASYQRYFDLTMEPTPKVNESLAEISDLFVFDYIIGNTDRGMGKNNYVVGGCNKCNTPGGQKHKGPAQFLHIDQGSAFYKRPGPEGNPLRDHPGRNSTFCRFRKSLYERMYNLKGGKGKPRLETLWGQMKQTASADIFRHVKDSRAKAAQDRMDHIVQHVETRCFKKAARSAVLAFT